MRDFVPLDYFFGGVLEKGYTTETRAPILTQHTSNDAVSRYKVPFGII